MTLSEYLSLHGHGALTKLSTQINAHSSDVSNWAKGKRTVPPEFCVKIETATGGSVTRPELLPDRWEGIWPELKPIEEKAQE